MSREASSDARLKIVRLPHVQSVPIALGDWCAKDVEAGTFNKRRPKREHLKIVRLSASVGDTD